MTSLNFTHRTSTAALHAIFMAPGAPLANWIVPAAHISAPLQVALTNANIFSMSSGKVSQTDIDALVTALRHEAKFQDLLAASGTSTKTGSAASFAVQARKPGADLNNKHPSFSTNLQPSIDSLCAWTCNWMFRGARRRPRVFWC